MNEKIIKSVVLLSTFAVIYINYLAAAGAIGGITPAYVSDRYPTIITPSGYAFSIWGLIYSGIIVFTVYQLFVTGSKNFNQIRVLFIVSCAANMSWIFAWHNLYLGLSVIAMLTLLGALSLIIWKNYESDPGTLKSIVQIVFGIYFGWVSVAAVLNITIFLVSLEIGLGGLAAIAAACVVLVLITAAGVIVREKFDTALYPLTIAWALTAIGVNQSGKTAIVITCALGVVVLIFSSLSFVLKKQTISS